MFDHIQIQDRRERALVALAEVMLGIAAPALLGRRRPTSSAAPERILLLRLERVGDLVMALDAIATVRRAAPEAVIDLVVGSWNAPLASLLPGVDRVETLDTPWMARDAPGNTWPAMIRHAARWADRRYDMAINFEGDIRSHMLLALSRAPRRVGFDMAGGGALLTDRVTYDPDAHVAVNAARLVARALDVSSGGGTKEPRPTLPVPDDARRRAATFLGRAGATGTLVGLQPGAGRSIKEWDPTRLAEVGAELAHEGDVTLVLTGSGGDRPARDALVGALPADVRAIEIPDTVDLVVLAAILERLALFITGDTGPMHMAAAVGTPVVAIFGPSLPGRYAPLVDPSRIVRVDLDCSPCNRLRHPPSWCVGHVPDCLTGVTTADVVAAARELLGSGASSRGVS